MKISPKKLSTTLLATSLALGVTSLSAPFEGSYAYADPVRVEGQTQLPSFSSVVGAVSPAVVSVRVRGKAMPASVQPSEQIPEQFRGTPFEKFFGERFGFEQKSAPNRRRNAQPRASQGSGFFISGDGYLVTNNHVVEHGYEFTIVLSDGTTHEAKLIGTDERTDLAVLKIDADETFTYVDFAEENAAQVGDWVVAVGNPFGLGGTVTAGIVSARGRDIGAGPYDDFLQIDAAVNRGNSGGPAFNLQGEVVGVNTAIYSPSGGNVGIAFAIPASTTKAVVAELIDNGLVERGWLGVQIRPVTSDIADAVGLKVPQGAIVAEATADGPAFKAGLKAGDIVLSVDGDAIDDPKDLANTIADIDPGANTKLIVWRNGSEESIQVTLGELPRSPEQLAQLNKTAPATQSLEGLGLELQSTPKGEIAVASVAPNSEAARKGFRPGDIIEKINGRPVAELKSVQQALASAKQSGRSSALFQLKNETGTRFSTLPVEEIG